MRDRRDPERQRMERVLQTEIQVLDELLEEEIRELETWDESPDGMACPPEIPKIIVADLLDRPRELLDRCRTMLRRVR